MGFYSGTSTGPNDLIDKLRIALLAEGWTVDNFSAIGAGYRLHVYKTLDSEVSYFNFRSAIAETGVTLITEDNITGEYGTVTGLIVNGSTGYDGGELWHKQPGYPQSVKNGNKSFGNVISPMSISAIPSYYFFFNGDSIHIAVEITAGKFQFMSFGMLVKDGVYTGGQYFTATLGSRSPGYDYMPAAGYGPRYFCNYNYWASTQYEINGAVRITADEVTSWRNAGNGLNNDQIVFPCPNEYSPNSISGIAEFFYSKSPSSYNAIAAHFPLYTFLLRSDDNYSRIGWPEGVRFLNVTNYDPAEELVLGGDTWLVFPADGINIAPINVGVGFAFLKDE